jgi:hypothetical protein
VTWTIPSGSYQAGCGPTPGAAAALCSMQGPFDWPDPCRETVDPCIPFHPVVVKCVILTLQFGSPGPFPVGMYLQLSGTHGTPPLFRFCQGFQMYLLIPVMVSRYARCVSEACAGRQESLPVCFRKVIVAAVSHRRGYAYPGRTLPQGIPDSVSREFLLNQTGLASQFIATGPEND